MESSKVNSLHKELNKLELVSGIIGSAIVNRNGITIVSKLPRYIDERKFGALAATMFGAIETATEKIQNRLTENQFCNLTIEYDDSLLIVLGTNDELITVVLVELNLDLGLILIEVEVIIRNIQKITNR